MSKYFKTLDRLKSESWAESDIRGFDTEPPTGPERHERSSRKGRHLSILEPAFQDSRSIESLSHLSEGIRALTHSNSAPGAVVAGIGSSGPIDIILNRVGQLATQSGIRLAIAEFDVSRGARILRMRHSRGTAPQAGSTPADSYQPFQIPVQADLDLSAGWEEARRWINKAATACDLFLIKAPPILELVDGALLAKIAGGLVLVVELHRTRRTDLASAVSRARASECPILGVVTAGRELSVPKWLADLISPSTDR